MNVISIRLYILAAVKNGVSGSTSIGKMVERLRAETKIGIGDVAGALFNLVQEGLLIAEASGTRSNGKIYKVTPKGAEYLAQQVAHLTKLIDYIEHGDT